LNPAKAGVSITEWRLHCAYSKAALSRPPTARHHVPVGHRAVAARKMHSPSSYGTFTTPTAPAPAAVTGAPRHGGQPSAECSNRR
jgi:hypothetical protein